jgi:hypothetical protein
MLRHELLKHLHKLLNPRTYLEIGVSVGGSLHLSRTSTIGIDPAFRINREVLCDLYLARITSDEFFARPDPLAHFPEPVIDLAFIDGMHLSEYALRDLINVERYTTPASVIVLDDMLPRHVDEAGRGREAGARRGAWAGDVFKVISTVLALRPDVVCLEVDTKPTGTAVILLPNASSTKLSSEYDDLVEQYVVPDPQHVPDEVLNRTRAIQPEMLLDAPIWSQMQKLRELDSDKARDGMHRLLGDAELLAPIPAG